MIFPSQKKWHRFRICGFIIHYRRVSFKFIYATGCMKMALKVIIGKVSVLFHRTFTVNMLLFLYVVFWEEVLDIQYSSRYHRDISFSNFCKRNWMYFIMWTLILVAWSGAHNLLLVSCFKYWFHSNNLVNIFCECLLRWKSWPLLLNWAYPYHVS